MNVTLFDVIYECDLFMNFECDLFDDVPNSRAKYLSMA